MSRGKKMKTPANRIKKLSQQEKGQSSHINITGHHDDTTLMDKNGQLVKLFTLTGVDAMTQAAEQLDILKNRRNSLWKNMTSHYALYSWTVRTKNVACPDGEFEAGFARQLDNAYRNKIQDKALFHNQLYLALVAKPGEGYINKIANGFKRLNHRLDQKARKEYIRQTHTHLNQTAEQLLSALQPYGIRLLGTEQKSTHTVSESLSFLGELINGTRRSIPLLPVNASALIPCNRLFFHRHSGAIEAHHPDGQKRYGAIFSVKAYASFSKAGLLDELSHLPLELIITQSYRFFDRQLAQQRLKEQQAELEQTQDDAISQTDELTDALDETASGDIGYGAHHLSILAWTTSLAALTKAGADIIATLSKQDMIAVREDMLAECAFWGQLPGNFAYLPRPAPISTRNFSGFSSFHNDSQGNLTGNHWGDAVTVLETRSGSPYYFNFHYRDVGNTLIFGAMGAGKTALMGFLLSQSLKFGGKRIVFDKDRGLEILVRALKGHYAYLTPGRPTGFNPCLLADTKENRSFLAYFFKSLLTLHHSAWSEHDSETVEKVITGLYHMPACDRRFCHIAPYFGAKVKGSLRARFDEWHSQGNKAWAFDNEFDTLNLAPDLLGFELGAILKDADTKTPLCLYLMHRVNQALEGQRGGIFMDEGWAMLDDDYFKKELEEWGRTPRKKNRFLCLATQSADDAAASAVNDVLSQSAACKIFFPNPAARESTYRDALGLTAREYQLIKTLEDDRRFFLLNYGKGKESVVVRADLSGLDAELAVISGRELSVLLLDALRAAVGDNPDNWLPLFNAMIPLTGTLRAKAGHDLSAWVPYFLDNRASLCG
jgi:type IV secretion system protein VirB4